MLPPSAGNIILSEPAYKKLQMYYQQFCTGTNRTYYGLGHMVYACHAAFPLLLSPHLANIIWLNFKNYYSGSAVRTISAETVSDFLASPICREIAHQQFEIDPEVRAYLLYHLKNSEWFAMYGIQPFGEERIYSIADCIWRYLKEPAFQQQVNQKGFREVNEWAVLAYRDPQLLASTVAQSLKNQIDSSNSPGQLRINMLMEKLNQQMEMKIHTGSENDSGTFINLFRYSKARKAVLFDEEPDMIFSMLNKIEEGLTNSATVNSIELPIEKNVQERIRRKTQDIQQVHALFVGVDKYSGETFTNLRGCASSAILLEELLVGLTEPLKYKINTHLLTDEKATREAIMETLASAFEGADPEDIVLFFFSGHAMNADFNENFLVTYDATSATEGYSKGSNANVEVNSEPLSNTYFLSELRKWKSLKNCQFVMIIDTHTGYYNWVEENDIFIGAVTHDTQMEYQKEEMYTSSFFAHFSSLLSVLDGPLTYENLFELVRHRMKFEAKSGMKREFPVLITTGENKEKFFLKNRRENAVFYYLASFNPQHSLWEIVPKDFLPLTDGSPINFFIDLDNKTIEKNRGRIVADDERKLYYTISNGSFPRLDSEKFNKVEPVKPPLLFSLHYDPSEVSDDIAENFGNHLEEIMFDRFSPWRQMQQNTSFGATVDNPEPENIPINIELSLRGTQLRYKINSTSSLLRTAVVKAFEPGKLTVVFKRFTRHQYFSNLQLPKDGIMGGMDIGMRIRWSLKNSAGRWLNEPSELNVDGRFIEVSDGIIKFPAIELELSNRELFPLFIDVYIILSDGSISRMGRVEKFQGRRLEADEPKTITLSIDASEMMIKMYDELLEGAVKLLISRNPITNDFSQPAIFY